MSKKKPEEQILQPQEAANNEALFEALGKSKKRRRRKTLLTVLIIVAVVVLAIAIAVNYFQKRVQERFDRMSGEVLSYTVQTGSISTVVSGSGTLANVDTETVSVPDGVELEEMLVEFGDLVKEGDLLAVADMASVKTALSDLQDTIEDLDEEIGDAEADEVSSFVRSGVSGRVKIIHAAKGDKVADVMMEQGALAVLSLDGYMAVQIQTDALAAGDSVTVTLSSGKTLTGTVEGVVGTTATVLVTDNGPQYDEEVTVALEGAELGKGKLYIHNSLAITGYAGTVKSVLTQENSKVSDGTKLFSLTDTKTSANYDALLRERAEAEETLLELLQIQRHGGIIAPISGSVYSAVDLDEEDADLTSAVTISPDEEMSVTITVDEADILALELGQEADVTVSSVTQDTLKGLVTEIDETASEGYYTAEILLSKIEGMLPGMTAEVDVRIQGVEDAMIIPVEALHHTSTGAYVYTAYDESLQQYGGKTDVVVGLQGSNYVEIKSGLKLGDTVYYTESMTIMDLFMNMTGMGGMGGNQAEGQIMGGADGPSGNFGGQMPEGDFHGQVPEEYADKIPAEYADKIPEGYGG